MVDGQDIMDIIILWRVQVILSAVNGALSWETTHKIQDQLKLSYLHVDIYPIKCSSFVRPQPFLVSRYSVGKQMQTNNIQTWTDWLQLKEVIYFNRRLVITEVSIFSLEPLSHFSHRNEL